MVHVSLMVPRGSSKVYVHHLLLVSLHLYLQHISQLCLHHNKVWHINQVGSIFTLSTGGIELRTTVCENQAETRRLNKRSLLLHICVLFSLTWFTAASYGETLGYLDTELLLKYSLSLCFHPLPQFVAFLIRFHNNKVSSSPPATLECYLCWNIRFMLFFTIMYLYLFPCIVKVSRCIAKRKKIISLCSLPFCVSISVQIVGFTCFSSFPSYPSSLPPYHSPPPSLSHPSTLSVFLSLPPSLPPTRCWLSAVDTFRTL